MKQRLIEQYGSLRKASVKTGVNYYRISQIINGWVTPRQDEIEKLGITEQELKDTAQKRI